MSENKYADELVRICATSYELFVLGHGRGNMKMPKSEVMLSEAIKTIDEFCEEVKKEWEGIDWELVEFDVYACKDGFHLLSCVGGKIMADHRMEERPKSPKMVYLRLMDGGENPPRAMGSAKKVYAEWAEREMEKHLAAVVNEIDWYRKWNRWENLSPKNLFFDVCGDSKGLDYRYSYKDGQRYQRTFSEKEEEKKKELRENMKKVLVKVWIDSPKSLILHDEFETPAYTVDYYMIQIRNSALKAQKEEEEEGRVAKADWVFFETYDAETGKFLKKYKIVGRDIVEEESETYGALPFMRK